MKDGVDYYALWISIISLVVASTALWLNWQKNAREIAAQRPQVAIRATPTAGRAWTIDVTVKNTLAVPIFWRSTVALAPAGLLIRAINSDVTPQQFEESPDPRSTASVTLSVAAGETLVVRFLGVVDDRYGVARDARVVLEPLFDGVARATSRIRRAFDSLLVRQIGL